MNTWDYFRSGVILLVAVFLVRRLFNLDYFESSVLILLMIVCIFHTMDIRDHIYAKVAEKRRTRSEQ